MALARQVDRPSSVGWAADSSDLTWLLGQAHFSLASQIAGAFTTLGVW